MRSTLDGRVALVTGSTDGIGRETARRLADAGATVLLHGRDERKGREALESIAADARSDDLHCYTADLADADAVRDLADSVRTDFDRLDVLVANAGTWQSERRTVAMPGCAEGVELTFAVNHLGHFLLTHLLVDRLAGSAQTDADDADGDDADATHDDADSTDADATHDDADATDADAADPSRIVVVASDVHRRAELDLDAVCGPDGPAGVDAYAQSKLANVMFTYELARRLPDGVTANCCHPGVAPATSLDRDASLLSAFGWRLYGLLGRVVGSTDSPRAAAETPAYLAISLEVADVTGEHFADREPTRSSEASHDRAAQRDLWDRSAEWVGLDPDERL